MSILSSPSSNCPRSSQAPQSIGWVHAQDQEEQCQPQSPPAPHSSLMFRQPGPYLTLKAVGLGFWLEMRSPVDFFFALFSSISQLQQRLCNSHEELQLPAVGGWGERKPGRPPRPAAGIPALNISNLEGQRAGSAASAAPNKPQRAVLQAGLLCEAEGWQIWLKRARKHFSGQSLSSWRCLLHPQPHGL